MSKELLSREICERALRLIGAFPTTESAADPEQLRETLYWLDLRLAELAGIAPNLWLVANTVSLTLSNNTQTYDLESVLGSDLPTNGIQFPREAYIQDAGGNRNPIEIVSRQAFEDVSLPAETGTPSCIYIDRLKDPTLSVYPTLPSDETTVYTIKLVVQTYAPDVTPSGVSGTQPSGSRSPGVRQAWQRYLVYAVASDIGAGPVYTIPSGRLRDMRKEAEMALSDLLSFENQEHTTTPPICEPYWY